MMSAPDFQSYAGPGDRFLPNADSEISGYQPVSRIGEVVMNAFVDAYEFVELNDNMTRKKLTGDPNHDDAVIETKPMFHEWATVQPGMILLARKKKTAVFRQYVAAETAVPVIACAACLGHDKEQDFFFAGVARSKSVRGPDDGMGPSVDEFFTTSIGGMVTLLNTSGGPIHPGDLIEWSLSGSGCAQVKGTTQRGKANPRRIGIEPCSVSSAQCIGRALSFSKRGETFDLLLKM